MQSNDAIPSDFMAWYDSLSSTQQREVEARLIKVAAHLGIVDATQKSLVPYHPFDFYPHVAAHNSIN